MPKYRILKTTFKTNNNPKVPLVYYAGDYKLQKRFLFFWWSDILDENNRVAKFKTVNFAAEFVRNLNSKKIKEWEIVFYVSNDGNLLEIDSYIDI